MKYLAITATAAARKRPPLLLGLILWPIILWIKVILYILAIAFAFPWVLLIVMIFMD